MISAKALVPLNIDSIKNKLYHQKLVLKKYYENFSSKINSIYFILMFPQKIKNIKYFRHFYRPELKKKRKN